MRVQKTKDGETLTAVIHAGDFDGYWLSKTDLHYTIALHRRRRRYQHHRYQRRRRARTHGHRLASLSPYHQRDRSQARVHLPADLYGVVDTIDGRPTGELKPVEGTANDYRFPQGHLLPDASTSVNFSKSTVLPASSKPRLR